MNVWGVFKVCLRHWYVFLPLLAITIVLAVKIPKDSEPTYTVTSQVGVLMPTVHQERDPITNKMVQVQNNPILNDNQGAWPVAQLLAQVLSTKTVEHGVVAGGYTEPYVVHADDKQPLLTISTEGHDDKRATAENKFVFDRIQSELDDRQKEYLNDPTKRVTLGVLVAPEVTDIAVVSKYRGMAAIGIAGLIVSLLVTLLFAAIVGRRPRRNSTSAGTRGTHTSTSPSDPVLTR